MPRWSTSAAELFIRKILAPLTGVGVFVAESIRTDEPRWLIVSAAVGLIIGQPVARILDARRTPTGPPDPPPSPADPGAGRS